MDILEAPKVAPRPLASILSTPKDNFWSRLYTFHQVWCRLYMVADSEFYLQ